MKYDRMTRWLHTGIALGVMVQLFSSLFMDVSAPRRPLAETGYRFFAVHHWSGITVVHGKRVVGLFSGPCRYSRAAPMARRSAHYQHV